MGLAVQLNCARHCEPRRQNGQSKPFSRSRRAAGFLWYFLSRRKKVLSPSGRQTHRPRRSRRVKYRRGNLRHSCRALMQAGGFPLAPCTPLARRKKSANAPLDANLTPVPESARQAPDRDSHTTKLAFLAACKGLSSGQTIGATCTAVRPARCLPELPQMPSFSFQHCTEIFPSRQDFPSSVR